MRRGHYVYLVRCADGSFYCGYALDPAQRVQTHNDGKGSKILRGKLPVRLAFVRRFSDKGHALRFELALKSRSHEAKADLARRWHAVKAKRRD